MRASDRDGELKKCPTVPPELAGVGERSHKNICSDHLENPQLGVKRNRLSAGLTTPVRLTDPDSNQASNSGEDTPQDDDASGGTGVVEQLTKISEPRNKVMTLGKLNVQILMPAKFKVRRIKMGIIFITRYINTVLELTQKTLNIVKIKSS